MYLGTSLVLIAVGAILRYAIMGDIPFVDRETAGLILIVVGVLALAISLIVMITGADRRRDPRDRDRDPRDAPTRRY